MSRKARIKRLEQSLGGTCPGCTARITFHHEYRLANGETITLPPFPERPHCTCGRPERRISAIIFDCPSKVYPDREAVERHYAEYAAFHRPWQPDGDGLEKRCGTAG